MDSEQLVNTISITTVNVESQNVNVFLKKYKDVSHHQMMPAGNVTRTGLTAMSAMNAPRLTATKCLPNLKQYTTDVSLFCDLDIISKNL